MFELSADAMRQYIDACACFTALEEAIAEAAQVRGGMYWHKGSPTAPQQQYLIRTSHTGGERSLGPRSPESEAIFEAFRERKSTSEQRLASLRTALDRHKRMNRALKH